MLDEVTLDHNNLFGPNVEFDGVTWNRIRWNPHFSNHEGMLVATAYRIGNGRDLSFFPA